MARLGQLGPCVMLLLSIASWPNSEAWSASSPECKDGGGNSAIAACKRMLAGTSQSDAMAPSKIFVTLFFLYIEQSDSVNATVNFGEALRRNPSVALDALGPFRQTQIVLGGLVERAANDPHFKHKMGTTLLRESYFLLNSDTEKSYRTFGSALAADPSVVSSQEATEILQNMTDYGDQMKNTRETEPEN
ncbi:hypothetical protein GFPCMMHI_02847 [Ensifer adhaerens]|nr:hypothetical protein [Ensifer adhaerens]